FRLAAEKAAALVVLSGIRRTSDPSRFGPSFRNLRTLSAALPLPRPTYALLANMVSDAEALLARREFGAAQWQLRQATRRLRRPAADWPPDADPASHPPARPPTVSRTNPWRVAAAAGPGRLRDVPARATRNSAGPGSLLLVGPAPFPTVARQPGEGNPR